MNNLKKLRESKNLTTRELAVQVNINQSTITNLENGKTSLNDQYIAIFTEFFGVSADYLLGLPQNAIPFGDGTFKPVKILGSIRAGEAAEMKDDFLGFLVANVDKPEDYFYLEVKGNSMSPTFEDGDYVLVKFQNTAENNQIVVAGVNGSEATVKRFKKIGNDCFLFPDNKNYEPLKLTPDLNPFFVGIVEGFFRPKIK